LNVHAYLVAAEVDEQQVQRPAHLGFGRIVV
jgi:hypothetical protein